MNYSSTPITFFEYGSEVGTQEEQELFAQELGNVPAVSKMSWWEQKATEHQNTVTDTGK